MVRNAQYANRMVVLFTIALLIIGGVYAAEEKERLDREARLIEVLKSSASFAEKDQACRDLQIIGTPASIPALAALLADQELSHMARYALQPMPYPQAGQALRDALAKTSSLQKVGIINSLGYRREKDAVPELIQLLADADAEVISAAAAALGRIGTMEAALALDKFRAAANPTLQAVAAEACLNAAERLLADNRPVEAVKIYEPLQGVKWPIHVRQGAFTGLLQALPNEATARTMRAVEGKDAVLKSVAVSAIPTLKDPAAAGRFAALLPKLAVDIQILMISALADCESKAVLPAIQTALENPNQDVQLTAVKALGKAGDASCVKSLVRLLTEAKAESLRKETIGSLERLRGEGVNAELLAYLKTASPDGRITAIGILVSRRATDSLDGLFQEAKSGDMRIREAAFKALGNLGGPQQLPALLKILTELKGDEDRKEAELAMVRLARKIPAENAQADLVMAALQTAKESAIQCSLLRILGGIANWKALDAVRTSLTSKVPEVKETALNTLIGWPNAKAMDLLLGELRTAANPGQQTSILRGGVRLMRRGDGLPSQIIARYQDLLGSAQRPEDKMLVLSGLAEVADPAALPLVLPFLNDAPVKAEAELAMLKIARRVMGSAPAAAKEAANRLKTAAQGEEIRRQAAEVVRQIEQSEEFLMTWQVSGPYSRMGGEGLRLYEIVLPPETGDQDVKWQDLTLGSRTERPWMLDLAGFLGEARMRAAYARTWIFSERAQSVVIDLEVDDPVKIWLNKEIIHLHNIPTSAIAVKNQIGISLKQGWNELMLKIVQGSGPWEFSVKMHKPSGGKPEGVRLDAAYGEKVQLEQLYAESGGNWIPLFNGKDLSGWRKTGEAVFTVEEGMLIGTQTTGKGGDLYTEKEWDNFELRVTYRIVWPANTGFWFRTTDGKGYQFDVLKWKKPLGYSGTLYTSDKMFLTVNLNEALENRNDWNEARIRAQGDELTLWLNGIKVGECRDSSFPKGAFGIQVHPGDDFKGMKVLIKNMDVRSRGPATK